MPKNAPSKKRAETFIDSGYRVLHERASRELRVDDSLSPPADLAKKPFSLIATLELRERAYLIEKGLLRPSSSQPAHSSDLRRASGAIRVLTAPAHNIDARTRKTSKTPAAKKKAARAKADSNKKRGVAPPRRNSIQSSAPNSPISEPKRCELCGHLKLSARHEKDFCLKRGQEAIAPKVAVQLPSKAISQVKYDLDFDPFPPSAISHRDAYRLLYGLRRTKAFFDKYEDPSRAKGILELEPNITHLGKKAWKGYAVYEFGDRFQGRVVLESIKAPNATYILSSRWRTFISLSKMDVRQQFADECCVVIHQDQWQRRVVEALESKRLGVL